jgi:DNA cross-link repair 1A protein
MLSVDKKWVHPLPMDVATEIPDTGGVRVTTIDANHCPGSALFLFEGRQTAHAGDSSYKSPAVGTNKVFRYLHCGDFRANPQHVLHPAVNGKKIDTVYLDTTYLDPKVSLLPCIFSTSCWLRVEYCFPPQPLVISACAELAKKLIAGETVGDKGNGAVDSFFAPAKTEGDAKLTKRNPVVIVGTYSVGKERVVKG